jgi:hypothetical protein
LRIVGCCLLLPHATSLRCCHANINPDIKSQLAQVGGVPLVCTPGEPGALIARETAKWVKVIKQAGIEPQ